MVDPRVGLNRTARTTEVTGRWNSSTSIMRNGATSCADFVQFARPWSKSSAVRLLCCFTIERNRRGYTPLLSSRRFVPPWSRISRRRPADDDVLERGALAEVAAQRPLLI